MDDVTIKCIGLNDKATEQVFKDTFGEEYDYQYFKGIISERYHKMCDKGKLPMKPGVVELLSFLKEKNVKVALASSTRTETVTNQLKDAHIYVNQVEGIKEQIKRFEQEGDLPAPKLWINPEIKNVYDFDNSKELKDIKITGYKHMGKIEFPIAQ